MWKKILISSGLLACLSCPQFTSDAYTVLMHQTDVNMNLTYRWFICTMKQRKLKLTLKLPFMWIKCATSITKKKCTRLI